MDFTKISYAPPKEGKPGTVRLEWTVTRIAPGGELVTDERTLRSTDAPHPDFTDALQALAPAVCAACFVTEEEREDAQDELAPGRPNLVVRSVTLKAVEDAFGELSDAATITALRELDWADAPLVLNTPFAPVSLLPHPGLDRLLDALRRHAKGYAEGRRAQAGLFDDAQA